MVKQTSAFGTHRTSGGYQRVISASHIGCRGVFESRVIQIDHGIINVKMQGIFGIGCLSCYRGISGLNGLFGRSKARQVYGTLNDKA